MMQEPTRRGSGKAERGEEYERTDFLQSCRGSGDGM